MEKIGILPQKPLSLSTVLNLYIYLLVFKLLQTKNYNLNNFFFGKTS